MAANTIAAHVLMKKGKRGAADYVHSNPQHLSDLLDLILNPKKPIDEWETIDWVKWLMAGGRTPDEFTSIVLRYDNSMTCGLVWTANYVAYRCRTCGISPCMSLCAQCFQKGDHAGHDFNMFKSQAGGACDCGDMSVMKETGFCERHGPKATVSKPAAPGDLMCVAHGVVPRIILRLIQHLRDNSAGTGTDAILLAVQDADAFLSMMHELSAMGAAMRRVLTGALTNPQMYKLLTSADAVDADYTAESHRFYQAALASVPNPAPPDEYRDCPALQEFLVHRSFLEELVFWTVKFEFPQKMVCLLLNMLPDPDYKEALTQAFVLHYSRISMMLERSPDPDTLSNRVVHVSVQLFSNEALALRMTEKLNLLHVMVVSLKYMMANILIDHTLHDSAKNFHRVVDCSRQVMKEHCYWPLVSDLNNVLGHGAVAVKFMSDDGLLEMWFAFLSMFQGMNVNQRELTAHVEFEPNTYYAAFSAELEASAYPMWALVSHLHHANTVGLTKRVLASCLTALQDWLDAIDYTTPRINDSMQVSFHLPLHRYFAVLLCQAVKTQGLALKDVLPPRDMLSLAMMHPLRVQVAFYEVLTGMWVRNGLQIKGQAMTYIQCNFCNSMVDADLFLLQICATQLPPDAFLETVIEKFHVSEWMSLSPSAEANSAFVEGDQETPMLESCLTFLATLMCVRTNLGETDSACSQLEMVTLLCMGDKTHSQLMELMPERCGTAQSRDFESVLAEVADYKAPNLDASGNMQQGMYVPTAAVWTEMYDPIHVLLRAVHRRDFQTSMDRFTEFGVQSGALKAGAAPWPPFRPPAPTHPAFDDPRRVLRSRVFHAACFVVLHKAVHSAAVSEHVAALTVFLLEMAVATAEPRDQHTQVCYANRGEREIKDKELSTWYESDWLSCNLRTVVRFVKMEPEPVVVFDSDDDSDAEWESTEMDDTEPCAEPRPPRISAPALPDLSMEEAGSASTAAGPAGFQLVPAGGQSSASSSSATTPTDGQLVPTRMPALPSPDSPQRTLGSAETAPTLTGGVSPARLALTDGAGTSTAGTTEQASAPGTSSQMVASGSGSMAMAGPGSARQLSSLYRQLAVRRAAREEPAQARRATGTHRRKQVQGDTRWTGDRLEVQESLISLLLKLHCHLAGSPDSFVPDEPGTGAADEDSRVGDGRFFVGKLLNRICQLDSLCREDVLATKERLWPRQQQEECEDEQREREAKERDERRRRAKERQQKLMEEFASRQKQFMERAMETDEEGVGGAGAGMDWSETGSVPLASKKEYDCVICNQTTPSSEDKPMGLVVLVQASSVLGHRQRADDGPRLPTSDAERAALRHTERQAAHFDKRLEELNREFDSSSWLVSLSLGWEGGVHLQTCGHHLHLDCLTAYLHSLRTQQRQQSIAVERGEYWCPLCRQLANSVLPLSPRLGECAAVVRSRPAPLPAVVAELARLLKENPPAPVASSLAEAMAKSMEDMTESTAHKFKQKSVSPTSQSLFLFVSSIARTNLEIEIVQRGGSLVDSEPADAAASLIPKRACIVPLLHVLAMHARLLACWPTWAPLLALAGQPQDGAVPGALAVAPLERQVPLLLRDPSAMLTQMVLLLPLHLDLTYFSCVVKLLYNLLYVQAVAQVCCSLSQSARARYRSAQAGAETELDRVMALVVTALDRARTFLDDDGAADVAVADLSAREVELEVQRLCVPFLRTAALLRHHLYEQPLPAVATPRAEFVRLVYFLELVTDGMDWHRFNAAAALNWVSDDGISTASAWTDELAAFASRCPAPARALLAEQHVSWRPPRLLALPQLYDRIFQYYQAIACSQCQSVPRETSVCLLCGTLICLKENCCKQLNVCEAVHHSVECGGGTGVFLVVTSSYVIVVRGKRACLWGSVYLDSHGEEDRELKRGKPLSLSAGRYRLLEQQWLAHRFDHTNKKWVWHRDAL